MRSLVQVEIDGEGSSMSEPGVLGWDSPSCRPLVAEVCVKKLTNKGFHTFVGMIGYCQKDEHEQHFESRMKNINDEMLRDGKHLYMLLRISAQLSSQQKCHRTQQQQRVTYSIAV